MKQNKLVTIFQNSSLFVWIVIIALYVLFHQKFESLFTTVLVEPLLSACGSELHNDSIIFILVICLVSNYYCKFAIRYIPSENMAVSIGLLAVGYSFYRYQGEPWHFTSFCLLPQFKYFDFIYTLFILNSSLYLQAVFRKHKLAPTAKRGFNVDIPLGETGKDLLDYETYAKEIALKMKQSRFESGAFAMGITGSWGSGKTSFANLIKRHLRSDDIVLIDFTPWDSLKPESISQDFFNVLQSQIKQYHSTLPGQIKEYSKKLLEFTDSGMLKYANGLVGFFSPDNSISDQKEKIKQTFAQIGKHFIVFIDDLDRLDKKELIEVIRLIRNTANFPHTTFVASYDRSYLIEAIQELNNNQKEFFLEKIFQLEVNMPHFDRNALISELLRLLKFEMHEKYYKELEQFLKYGNENPYETRPQFSNFLSTIRDCTRFANSFLLHFNMLKGEVSIKDLFVLELLRFKYPGVYSLLYKQKEEFLVAIGSYDTRKCYKLEKSTVEKVPPTTEYNLKTYLLKNAEEVSVPKNKIEEILALLLTIFKDNEGLFTQYLNQDRLSVIYPSNYYRYFSFRLAASNLSSVEFSNYRHKSQVEFNEQIKIWEQKSWADLNRRFNDENEYDNREDFEKIIRGIFFLGNLPMRPGKTFGYYDPKDLAIKLTDYNKKLSKGLYGGEENLLKNFVLSLFEEAPFPYGFESNLIREILRENHLNDFPLTLKELQDIQVNYFANYLTTIQKIDGEVWDFYHKCSFQEWIEVGSGRYQGTMKKIPEAITLFVNFIRKKDLDGFFVDMVNIDHQSTDDNRTYYINNEVIKALFSDWKSFEKFLLEKHQQPSSYLEEYREFFNRYKESNYAKSISFDFITIPISARKH